MDKLEKRKQYDLTRNDKFYQLSIPRHVKYKDCVFYQIHLRDLVKNERYIHQFRYKQLKEYHDTLQQLKLQLPEFPKTHFWKKTNKNPQMIKQRQVFLQRYFSTVVNDPFIRGYDVVKKFIKMCKLINRGNRWFSDKKVKRVLSKTKSKSLSNPGSDLEIRLQLNLRKKIK